MSRNFTIAQLITKGRRRCDQENRDILSAAEWQEELSTIFGEFHGLLTDAGMRFYESSDTITGVAGTQDYALPSDFLASVGVDYEQSADGQRIELQSFLAQERNVFSGSSGGQSVAYALIGQNVRLYPAPATGQTYYHIYVPQPADISTATTSDNVDVVTPNGEAFFTWSLALVGGIKEESDLVPYYERQVDRQRERVIEWAMQRELYTPKRRYVDSSGTSGFTGVNRDDGDYIY